MLFSELPIETQTRLNSERLELCKKQENTSYCILLYNEAGTRYLLATRHQHSWNDDKGHYMPFGGGSEWSVKYGQVGFARVRQAIGFDYDLVRGKCFIKSRNGVEIPKSVKTKKEVLSIAKQIGIFNI